MVSLIAGYEYDIFISYRQKDNSYDGWVTEFVENLEKELDSMFKEDITVYFDRDPTDYLQENYDVDASLKDKLKCLILIPVISRTYCDPKAFAWEHEFKAFVELASKDRFGLQVKLANNNIASRVLPVRIHDLESTDIALYESTIGGILRPIDFIYKETGVNRQLRAKDDDIIDHHHHVLYRDQINKVAHAIREIIQGMQASPATEEEATTSGIQQSPEIPKPEGSETNTQEHTPPELTQSKVSKRKRITSKNIVWLLLVLAVIFSSAYFINFRTKVKWAKTEGLQETASLTADGFYKEAFELAQELIEYIPNDTLLISLIGKMSDTMTVLTEPPGADFYIKNYKDINGDWDYVGATPIDSMLLPGTSFYRFKMVLAEHDTVCGALHSFQDTLSRKLHKKDDLPKGMVFIDDVLIGGKDDWGIKPEADLSYYIDKYEVTNRQFKEFVDQGGYRTTVFWEHHVIKNGDTLTWEEAMTEFVDKTGRPGPSTWEAGDYPDGKDNDPVAGVSWYEASAYAKFRNKVLPTAYHWDNAVGWSLGPYFSFSTAQIIGQSNFNDKHTLPVGQKQGVAVYGQFDMAGNVREWCYNESTVGRIISGGSYDGPTYMFTRWDQIPAFNRSHLNGFRCAIYPDEKIIPDKAYESITLGNNRIIEFDSIEIVPTSTFEIYRNQFRYDKKDLGVIVESRDSTWEDWLMEKVSLNAAYDDERLIAYVFLPKNASPPYQTLIFYPGGYAISSKDELTNHKGHLNSYFDYILKSGRAAVYPIYKGTYTRSTDWPRRKSHEYTDLYVKIVKDFSRTIDYLEARGDIDMDKIGFYGHSWGGRMGAFIPAVEDRISLNILVAAGFASSRAYPEIDEFNYITRVQAPTLILNGKYDSSFPLEGNADLFYDLLGTREEDKELYLIEAGHNFYKRNRIKPVLEWCDKYFGPPNPLVVDQ